jgi:Cytosol aminopeptidase family, catalytic domain
LADALWYAQEKCGVTKVLDIATLTGAQARPLSFLFSLPASCKRAEYLCVGHRHPHRPSGRPVSDYAPV